MTNRAVLPKISPGAAHPEPNRTRVAPAPLQINRRVLRRVLARQPEVLEALEAGALKATGRPGVNVASIWQLARQALYSSADVPVLGTRECLQNSADACKAAVAARLIRRGEGRFEVEWDAEARRLTWTDNGIGMDADTILTKFLVLGSSGKTGAASSDEAAGGFGIAKAVILGAASRFRWELHSRDNLAVSAGPDTDVQIYEAPFRLQGTRITVYDVSPEYDYWWDSAGGGRQPIEDRLKELLAANDLPDMTLVYNGEEVRPRSSRRGGSKIQVVGSWGPGTLATVKAYKRPDRRGAYWVRLNGLLQYKSPSSGDLGVDVVIDLVTTVRPGELGYPLNAGRDALQGEARYTFRALVEEVERENASVGDQQDDEVFDAELETDTDLDGDVQALTRSLLEDPALAKALEEVGLHASRPETQLDPEGLAVAPSSGELRPGAASATGSRASKDATGAGAPVAGAAGETSDARETSTPEETSGEGATAGKPVLKTDLPDEYEISLSPYQGRLPWFPAGLQTVPAVRQALERAERESPYEIHPQVLEALDAAATGAITVGQLRVIATEMDRAARMIAQTRSLERPQVQVVERTQKRRNGNPFGHLGALRVSKLNYDKAKARAFKRNPKKHLPMLVLWDTTLKLVAHAGGILRAVKPGFVLEDGVVGLAQRRPDSPVVVIYIHPDRLNEVIQQHRERPLPIAAFLHGVACHELTHADGRMGDGHSESWISAREDLGRRTAQVLTPLASIATRLLKLPEPKDEASVKLERLEKQLQKLTERRWMDKREKTRAIKQLERDLARCRQEIETRAAELSAEARIACTGTCGCRNGASGSVPSIVRVPPPGDSSSGVSFPEPALQARAERTFKAIRDGLLSSLPAGVSPHYAEAFLARYRALLLEKLTGALERRDFPAPPQARAQSGP